MTSRLVKSLFGMGRLRVGSATAAEANNGSRMAFSTQIYNSSSVSPATSAVRAWYNLYVEVDSIVGFLVLVPMQIQRNLTLYCPNLFVSTVS